MAAPQTRRGMAGPGMKKARQSLAWEGAVPKNYFRPAAARSAAALSVRSQVNSGSSRPKWP